jgi:hypothetical protein
VRGDLVRLAAALAQCEMALVRRDPVAGALLAQAARHAEGLEHGEALAAAADLARASDPAGDRAARKVVQALVRSALIDADAELLA